ncbi:MAG: sigma-70 family RNA polymerase sigma factor [Saprospiraceae bacterium]|nr:sigma-70 family RNA polymerase sigma factor [Saprospiraceae bacterium]
MEITDQLLIECIKSSDSRKRNWAFYQFYSDEKIRSWARAYIQNQGGQLEDVEDVFQESIIVLDRNVRENRFEGGSALMTYFGSIIKWSWLTYKRKQKPFSELKAELIKENVESIENDFIKEERKSLINFAISKLDEHCRKLLSLYKLDYSMKEIKELLNISSPALAKKQAFNCRKKLRAIFLDNPGLSGALNIDLDNV